MARDCEVNILNAFFGFQDLMRTLKSSLTGVFRSFTGSIDIRTGDMNWPMEWIDLVDCSGCVDLIDQYPPVSW